MRPISGTDSGFYASLPVFDGFDKIVDTEIYKPLPEGWLLGVADIVGSTEAIAAGRYKSVNMAGASVITAAANAFGTTDFPFVFGGDGASFAIPASWAVPARGALSACIVFVREELDLSLRAAIVPVAAIRQQALDVRVARFAPSANVSYALFSGGGLSWAEQEMKRGVFAIEPAARNTRPDLAGLSCRFEKVPSYRGTILTLLVMPAGRDGTREFWNLMEALLTLTASSDAVGTPLSREALTIKWPPTGLDLEARARHKPGRSLWRDRLQVAVFNLMTFLIFRFEIRVGQFQPSTYVREVIENSDFRKYDDGLRMTLDCEQQLANRIEALLSDAAQRGIARYGLHRQPEALMTCFTPTVFGQHFHFIDGADGGYATASRRLAGVP
jgi:hypothetical protein